MVESKQSCAWCIVDIVLENHYFPFRFSTYFKLMISLLYQLLIQRSSIESFHVFSSEMGKNPHCLSSVLFGFYQISGFVRFGFFPAMKNESSVLVRFFVQSSVLFGSVLCRFLVYMFTICTEYTVWVKKNPPEVFWHFFPNGWEFLVQILLASYFSYLR